MVDVRGIALERLPVVDGGRKRTPWWGRRWNPDNVSLLFSRDPPTDRAGALAPARAPALRGLDDAGQGTDLYVVSEVLGHSSVAITKDVYGHLLEGQKRAAQLMSTALLSGFGSQNHERGLHAAPRGSVAG